MLVLIFKHSLLGVVDVASWWMFWVISLMKEKRNSDLCFRVAADEGNVTA